MNYLQNMRSTVTVCLPDWRSVPRQPQNVTTCFSDRGCQEPTEFYRWRLSVNEQPHKIDDTSKLNIWRKESDALIFLREIFWHDGSVAVHLLHCLSRIQIPFFAHGSHTCIAITDKFITHIFEWLAITVRSYINSEIIVKKLYSNSGPYTIIIPGQLVKCHTCTAQFKGTFIMSDCCELVYWML